MTLSGPFGKFGRRWAKIRDGDRQTSQVRQASQVYNVLDHPAAIMSAKCEVQETDMLQFGKASRSDNVYLKRYATNLLHCIFTNFQTHGLAQEEYK